MTIEEFANEYGLNLDCNDFEKYRDMNLPASDWLDILYHDAGFYEKW